MPVALLTVRRLVAALVLSGVAALMPAGSASADASAAAADRGIEPLDAVRAGRFAALALDCVQREYPNLIHHVMADAGEVAPPGTLTPAFYGCYDWHSAVHGHWLLARLARLYTDAPFAAQAKAALAANLTQSNLLQEAAYMAAPHRAGFERPYGHAWLLQLVAELSQWPDEDARQWREWLRPLEQVAVARLSEWLPKLAYPIRSGEHYQTAFAFGLVLDYARQANDASLERLVIARGRDFYGDDRNCPLAYEPSGHDFLSPCLAEADFMRRVLAPPAFAAWLDDFMPAIGGADWLPPARATDRSDGKLAHMDGLNLSRAWMLEGIAAGLPADDSRREPLHAAACAHARAGLAGVSDEHYAGSHWLASFAVYLLTRRGLSDDADTRACGDGTVRANGGKSR
jgi:hypothetical protein